MFTEFRRLLVIGAAAFALIEANAGAVDAPITEEKGLTYAAYGDRSLQLDLYRPNPNASPLPAIVCIHGGGWYKGDRASMTNLARALAGRGFATVSISYRLSGEAKFPAAIQDCKAAVRWLRANAEKYGIDRANIGVTGLSAGGHLAALLATSGGIRELEGAGGNPNESSAVQACMAMGAQSDLESERIQGLSRSPSDPFYSPFLGGTYDAIPQTYALASPRHHLEAGDPPMAFMCGELDDASTHADAVRFELMKLGVPTGLTVIPNAPHAFTSQPRALQQCVNVSDAFFTLHLKQHGHPDVASTVSGLFAKGAQWQLIGGGYAGCEGAQWVGNTLHFAAHHDHLAFQWSQAKGLAVWRDDSPEATSFRPDGAGGFYVVEQTTRRLTRWNEKARMVEVLADRFEGKRLNRPNDVVVRPSDGSLWFTDPDFLFKQRPDEVKELEGQFVYRFDLKTHQLSAVVRDLVLPNGIAFSPDGRALFVTDSGTPNVYRWSVADDGTLDERTVFATFDEKGLDGLAFDPVGRLWCCTKAGIHVLDPAGAESGLIQTPGKPTSIAFGPRGLVCVTTHDACFLALLSSPGS